MPGITFDFDDNRNESLAMTTQKQWILATHTHNHKSTTHHDNLSMCKSWNHKSSDQLAMQDESFSQRLGQVVLACEELVWTENKGGCVEVFISVLVNMRYK